MVRSMERQLKAFAATLLLGTTLAPAAHATRAYVSNERSSTVTVIDVEKGTVEAEWPVGNRPRGIAMTRDGKALLVAASADNAVEMRCLLYTSPSPRD